MLAVICLAIAKTLGMFILLSHLPKPVLHWFAIKHPVLADLFCMLVIPLPMVLFGGVKAMQSAVYFSLAMSLAIRMYRMHHERPVQERVKARFVRFSSSETDLRPAPRPWYHLDAVEVVMVITGFAIGWFML